MFVKNHQELSMIIGWRSQTETKLISKNPRFPRTSEEQVVLRLQMSSKHMDKSQSCGQPAQNSGKGKGIRNSPAEGGQVTLFGRSF